MRVIFPSQMVLCPTCGSDKMIGFTGDQVPQPMGARGESGHDIEMYDWIEFTCHECRHEWRVEE